MGKPGFPYEPSLIPPQQAGQAGLLLFTAARDG